VLLHSSSAEYTPRRNMLRRHPSADSGENGQHALSRWAGEGRSAFLGHARAGFLDSAELSAELCLDVAANLAAAEGMLDKVERAIERAGRNSPQPGTVPAGRCRSFTYPTTTPLTLAKSLRNSRSNSRESSFVVISSQNK